MDGSNVARKLLEADLDGNQIGGFVVGFIVLAFGLLISTLFTCTLSGKVGKLENRLETIESKYLGEDHPAAKLT